MRYVAAFYPPDLRDLVETHDLSWQVGRDGLMYPTLTVKPELRKVTFAGKLAIRIKRAENLHKTTSFGKMDPVVSVKFGAFENKTQIAKNGHINPEFNSVFEWPVDLKNADMDEIVLTVSHVGKVTNDFIGKVSIPTFDLVHLYAPTNALGPRKPKKKPLTDEQKKAADAKKDGEGELPPEDGLWFELGRDNHQKTPAGKILLSFRFLDLDPKAVAARQAREKEAAEKATKERHKLDAAAADVMAAQQAAERKKKEDEKTAKDTADALAAAAAAAKAPVAAPAAAAKPAAAPTTAPAAAPVAAPAAAKPAAAPAAAPTSAAPAINTAAPATAAGSPASPTNAAPAGTPVTPAAAAAAAPTTPAAASPNAAPTPASSPAVATPAPAAATPAPGPAAPPSAAAQKSQAELTEKERVAAAALQAAFEMKMLADKADREAREKWDREQEAIRVQQARDKMVRGLAGPGGIGAAIMGARLPQPKDNGPAATTGAAAPAIDPKAPSTGQPADAAKSPKSPLPPGAKAMIGPGGLGGVVLKKAGTNAPAGAGKPADSAKPALPAAGRAGPAAPAATKPTLPAAPAAAKPGAAVPTGASSLPPGAAVPTGASLPPGAAVPTGASLPPGAAVPTGASHPPGAAIPTGAAAPKTPTAAGAAAAANSQTKTQEKVDAAATTSVPLDVVLKPTAAAKKKKPTKKKAFTSNVAVPAAAGAGAAASTGGAAGAASAAGAAKK